MSTETIILILIFLLILFLASLALYARKHGKPRGCTCLEFIGDNGPCPVHGDRYPLKGKYDNERQWDE